MPIAPEANPFLFLTWYVIVPIAIYFVMQRFTKPQTVIKKILIAVASFLTTVVIFWTYLLVAMITSGTYL